MKILNELVLKNVIILILLAFLYPPIVAYTSTITDKAAVGSILTAISLVAVIACFNAFAFTYEKVNVKNIYERILGHFVSGSLIFITGICLIFTDTLLATLMGRFVIMDAMLALLYIAGIGYDFWDVLRLKNS